MTMGCLEIQTALNFKASEQYACKKNIYFNLVCCTHHRCLLPFGPEPSVFPSVVKKCKMRICKTIILYGCKTWSLTLREEHRLRRIFGPKRVEVTGEWRKLHSEELRDLYSSPSIIRIIKSRRMRWTGHVARMGEKRPLGRPRHWWVDNIKMDLLEIDWGGVDWIGLAQDRNKWRALVNAVMNLQVP
jgi:hypothetical protein